MAVPSLFLTAATAAAVMMPSPALSQSSAAVSSSDVAASGSFTCPFRLDDDGNIDEVDSASASKRDLSWCLPKEYAKERPDFVGRNELRGLDLSFKFDILEVKEVDDIGQSLSLPLYLSVTWPERRLWINGTHEAWDDDGTGPTNTVTEDPKQLLDQIWIPDLEIYGLEEYDSASVIKPMSGIRIWKHEAIEYNTRVTVKLSCRMDFHNYPFDSHVCRFQVGSYFYLKDIVTCTSEYSDPMSLSRQRNLQHRIGFEELRGNETVIRLESGEYAACGFRILLSRKRHQMMFQIYLPCFLFVCVSWASFLIKPNVVPGRMALLVTLFLVLVNIFNTVRSNAPVPSGSTLNAIDFYLVTSIIMVFLALLEYAAVLLAMHYADSVEVKVKKKSLREALKEQLRREEAEQQDNSTKTGLKASSSSLFAERRPRLPRASEEKELEDDAGKEGGGGEDVLSMVDRINSSFLAFHPRKALLMENSYKIFGISTRKVDLGALVVLPVAFVVFNVYYWVTMTAS